MSAPDIRLAGESSYELGAGQSIETVILPNFRVMLSSALQSVPAKNPTKIRLMFEVEQ